MTEIQPRPTLLSRFRRATRTSDPSTHPTLRSYAEFNLSPLEKELLFYHQLAQPDPFLLTPTSFQEGGIVRRNSNPFLNASFDASAAKVHRALVTLKILPDADTVKGRGAEEYIPVDTTRIDRTFSSELYFLSLGSQRKLVTLLFFWEEECVRLRLLEDEEMEIKAVIREVPVGMRAELKVRLEGVMWRKRQSPQERMARQVSEALPAYVR